jgi:UDP-3-O-[3-hydroxymyristoyl] glucosamine N-acyltransferase
MKLTLAELADILNGSVVGDSNAKVNNLSKIEEASSGDVTFISNPKYLPWIYKTNATAVIIDKGTAYNGSLKCNLIEVDNSYSAFNSLLKTFSSEQASYFGIVENAIIDSTSKLGKSISIGHFSVIAENCKIGNNVIIMDNVSIAKNVALGDNCLIHSGVRIYSDTIIGDNCIIHSNSVIGSDGFGYAPNKEGEYIKTPQIGNVTICDNVEIGSNTSIDRATLGSTVISEGVKIDNLVQIAHNVTVGKNTVIAGQCGIAGSTKIGENCQIGGQVGIIGHLTIGNNVKINGQAGVFSNIKDNAILKGTPAIDERTFNRSYVHFRNLEKIVKDVNQLKKNDAGNN